MTIALILLRLRGALPFLKRNWKWFAIALVILGLLILRSCEISSAYDRGNADGYAAATARQQAAYALALDRHKAQQAEANAASYAIGFREGKEQRVIQTNTRTIIERIPVSVTEAADVACPIPLGFVRVHDAAAAGSPTAGFAYRAPEPDAAASDALLSETAGLLTENYGACHANAEQLASLQELVRQFQALQRAAQ